MQSNKSIFILIVGLMMIDFYQSPSQSSSTEPPTVVIIIGGDIGWNITEAADLHTPLPPMCGHFRNY